MTNKIPYGYAEIFHVAVFQASVIIWMLPMQQNTALEGMLTKADEF